MHPTVPSTRPLRRALLLAASLGAAATVFGCPALDAGQPIVLEPGADWTLIEVEVLKNAASCWNLEFGTRLEVGHRAVDQRVEVVFNDFVCVYAAARTEPNLPVKVSLCPDLTFHWASFSFIPFYILLHELGHVLNIRPHSDGSGDVMSPGWSSKVVGGNWDNRFTATDRRLFHEANPGFEATPTCGHGAEAMRISGTDQWGCRCF